MKFLTPYRIATYVLTAFFMGHTGGGMIAQKSLGPSSDAVFTAMKSVHFDFNGASSTWYGFWLSFGLTTSLFLLLSAIVAWRLNDVPPEHWHLFSVIAWAFVLAHVGNAILTWIYFFPGAGIFATLSAVLLGLGAFQKERRATGA
jgi:hypothetical protein